MDYRNEEKLVLVEKREECCACGACIGICPKQAIEFKYDSYGVAYPFIDEEKCIQCGLCKKTCHYINGNECYFNVPRKVYAASLKNEEVLKRSASGGIFAVLAECVLNKNGIVYGSAFQQIDGELVNRHIGITKMDDLPFLQGSKYVQSDMGSVYHEVKQQLLQGKEVLFSGTPCQIVGLKSFLGKEYDKLMTVDIICHGVPSKKWFQDFLHIFEKKIHGKITQYKFRDKANGQGYTTKIEYLDEKNRVKIKCFDGKLTSYLFYFLRSDLNRENCYSCPYARQARVADVTLGDFWGIDKVHKEELKNSSMSDRWGISCVLLNTSKGERYFEQISEKIHFFESTYEKASIYNGQLVRPSVGTEERKILQSIYQEVGFEGINERYNKKFWKQRMIYYFKRFVPRIIRKKFKR